MTNTERFIDLMKQNRYTFSSLAKELNVAPATLKNKVFNKNDFKVSEILTLSRVFSINIKTTDFANLFFYN